MPRRVLFPFVGDSVGGSHISSVLLIKHLDRARYEPIVLLQQEGPLAKFLRGMGLDYQVSRLPALAGQQPSIVRILAAQMRSLPDMLRQLRIGAVDMIHTNDLRMHLTWSVAARSAGIPWVWHQRMLLSSSPLWHVLPLVAETVVCISNAVRETLPSSAATAAHVIYNPVDVEPEDNSPRYRAMVLEEFGCRPDTVLIGFVGNMTAQKRPLEFVSAAAALIRKTDLPVEFILFGDNRGGQLEEVRQRAVALGIESRVHFGGFRNPISPWIGAMDVLLAPGVGEGFGRTLIEAMSAGTAVVAADSGGHRELIEHEKTGLLVAKDDRTALAGAALRLIGDASFRQDVVQRAHVFVRTFTADQHASQIMTVYEDTLPHSKRLRVSEASS